MTVKFDTHTVSLDFLKQIAASSLCRTWSAWRIKAKSAILTLGDSSRRFHSSCTVTAALLPLHPSNLLGSSFAPSILLLDGSLSDTLKDDANFEECARPPSLAASSAAAFLCTRHSAPPSALFLHPSACLHLGLCTSASPGERCLEHAVACPRFPNDALLYSAGIVSFGVSPPLATHTRSKEKKKSLGGPEIEGGEEQGGSVGLQQKSRDSRGKISSPLAGPRLAQPVAHVHRVLGTPVPRARLDLSPVAPRCPSVKTNASPLFPTQSSTHRHLPVALARHSAQTPTFHATCNEA